MEENYLIRCLKKAFSGWLGRADTFSGVVTTALTALSHFNPWWSETVNTLLWLIPLSVFGCTIVTGLVLAPYLVHRDDVKEIKELRLYRQLKEKDKLDFSIVWYREEWRLREAHGWRNYWEDESEGIGLQLIGWIAVNIKGRIRLESIEIDIGGQVFKSDWQSQEFYTSEERELRFDVPFDIQRGKRTAVLKAVVDGQQYSPDPIMLNVPQGKQVFHK